MTVEERLARIESLLAQLVEREVVKDHYDIEELARIVGKSEYTVREWCRQGRIKADKQGTGRGKTQNWVISHAELLRLRRDGLLPLIRIAH